jgi:O-antigen ligase/tetratricopeptide (TPR) repeat protein
MAKKITQKDLKENSTVKTGYVAVDIIAIFFVVAYMAMDFIPYTSGVDNIGIQYLYLAVVNLITGVYLFRNPQLISKEYFGLLKNSYAIRAYLMFLILCGLSIFVSSHFSLSIISFTQLLITFCLFLNISILLHNRLHLINRIAYIFIILIFLQCFFELKHFIELSNSNSLFVALEKLTGNTGSINIFAANMATKIPFLLFGIFTFSKFRKWLSIITLFLAALLILLTASRASFLSLSIEAIVFMVILFKFDSDRKVKFGLIATIVIPLLLSYFTANQILAKSNDTSGRFQSVNSRVGQITELNEFSANTRLGLWHNATEITKKNPLLGIGIGNWQIESIPYEKYTADELYYSIHTHNDFLEIASETGVLNGVIFLLIFIFATIVNLRRIIKNNDTQIKLLAAVTLLMIITYGIDSVFNFPLHRPTMQYNLALILAFTLVNTPKLNELNDFKFSKKGISILILISSITIFFSYQLQQALLFENELTLDYKLPEEEQVLTATYIETNMPKFIEVNLSSVPFYEWLGKYYLKEKRYDKANVCFNLSEKINPYSGKSDYFRNKIAQEKGIVDSAYFYSNRALEIRPRNETYFYETINTALLKKDTIGILKLHYKFMKYRNDPKYWINSSSALILSNYNYKNVIQFIEQGLKAFPNDSSLIERRNSFEFDVLTKKALQLEKEKKYSAAIEIYNQILKKDGKNSTALKNLSTCYINLKNYKKAIYYLEKTLKFSKDDDGKFAFRLGVCYYSINNKVKGCYYIDQAVLKNYPNSINIRDKYCK